MCLSADLIPPVSQQISASMCCSLNLNARKTQFSSTHLIFSSRVDLSSESVPLTYSGMLLPSQEFPTEPVMHETPSCVSHLLLEGSVAHIRLISAGVKAGGKGPLEACFLECTSSNWSPPDMSSQWDAFCFISMWLSGGGHPAAVIE